jgi:hypothetical protein
MKTSKLLLAGLLAASALAGSASAQTAIYIAGAPAFRQIGTTAVINTLAATTTNGTTGALSVAYSGTKGLTGANTVLIKGGTLTKGGTAVTVEITYEGSTGAIQSLASGSQFPVYYLPSTDAAASITVSGGVITGGTGGYADPTATGAVLANFTSATPNLGLTDTFQNTTPFHGTNSLTGSPVIYANLSEYGAPSAIIAYKILGNHGTPSGLNLTPSQAKALFTFGIQPLALLTGNESDEGTPVYSLGRDPASGSRYIFLAETGIGSANDASLVQYEATVSGTGASAAITGYTLSPAEVINGVHYASGNTGYPSFSNVLTALEASSSVGNFITYVGSPDAATALTSTTNPAVEIAWNGNYLGDGNGGVTSPYANEGTAPANLAEGKYTYWSYIHVPYPPTLSSINSAAYTFGNNLYTDLGSDTTTGAVLVSDTGVQRGVDGGPVTPSYTPSY